MQDLAPFIPELLGTPGRKGCRALGVADGCAVRINLPATSKSIDIPVVGI
jgi:hypothetical protein